MIGEYIVINYPTAIAAREDFLILSNSTFFKAVYVNFSTTTQYTR